MLVLSDIGAAFDTVVPLTMTADSDGESGNDHARFRVSHRGRDVSVSNLSYL